MNTTLLKRFATKARKILLQGVGHRLEGMGFDLQMGKAAEMPQLLGGGAVFMGNVVSTGFYDRWMSLYRNIERRGLRDVAEEAAYTWFNRLVAIRILSKQGFISPVLQYESEDVHVPLIVSEARHGRMPEMSQHVRKELEELLNDDSKTNEQFALLIVAFCHSNPIINRCFGNITDYTELLLPQDILREDGFVDMLNNTPFISDEDYGSSELIGWLYQFYISDRKDEVFAKKGKYDADEIAPATQIFTPEWILQYMVQNTLGRIYLDNNPYAADEFKPKWKYLVDQEQRNDEHICHFDNLEDIRCADLGCGSGHIVGYMFEVLFDLYLYEGYSRRETVEHILKENLTGVDIDQRAKQLATFALLLKACQKAKSFADAKIMPNILDMPEPFVGGDASRVATGTDDARRVASYLEKDKYVEITVGKLPHWYQEGKTQFVTFRLADSLPQEKLQELTDFKNQWLKIHPQPWTKQIQSDYDRTIRRNIDKWLDNGMGSCILAKAEIRKIVEDALLFFDGQKYKLHAYVIMPNHVHVLITPLDNENAVKAIGGVKSFTAKSINKVLNKEGAVWQREVFDRIVRDGENFNQYVKYIVNNPHNIQPDSFSLGGDAIGGDASCVSDDNDSNCDARRVASYIREQFSHFILGSDTVVLNEIVDAVRLMDDAKTLGSIMKFNISERTRNILKVRLEDYEQQEVIPEAIQHMIPYVKVILALTESYTALVMNPPYMGSGRFDSVLSKYVKDNYADGKADLFSVFMIMAQQRLVPNGKYSMINMQSWMFLSSFEQLRKNLLDTMQIDSMLHLGPHTFDELSGEVVQNTSFVVSNNEPNGTGIYYRLVEGKNCADKEQMFLTHIASNDSNDKKICYPNVKQNDFEKIPGNPLVYWLDEKEISLFRNTEFSEYLSTKEGLITADNQRFLRFWFEPNIESINFNCISSNDALVSLKKWFPYNKAGSYRKWYGCRVFVVNWEKDGFEIKNFKDANGKVKSRPQNLNTYFKECISWSNITSGPLAFRYFGNGFIYDGCANAAFAIKDCDILSILGYCNTVMVQAFKRILNPTMHFNPGDFESLPFKYFYSENIHNIVFHNLSISKLDWDAHETSWDFSENPLVAIMKSTESEMTSENNPDDTSIPALSQDDATDISLRDDRHAIQRRPSRNSVTTVTQFGGDRHTSLQQPCNVITKPLYDDYNAAVMELQSFCNPANGVTNHGSTLEKCVNVIEKLWTARFMQLHANEEELNRQFIDIYGLQDELTPDVPLDEVTILQQGEITIKDNHIVWNENVLIKQLISYAVGVCMGRYRLDKAELHIAYPNPSDDDLKPYMYNGKEVKIDDDGIIPLMPSSSPFNDNMLKRLNDFIQVVFGDEYLNDNLNYMEKALGMTLEQYLIKDFWKDHKRMYQNRPIYWLFSSKKGAFQCIAYMHRMDAWTAERVRTKYLLPYIEYLVNKQNDMQANAANLTSVERRELDKITKQIAECREYHDRLHEVVDKEIAFDLDDGVVVNYAKFGNVLAKIK